MHREDGDAGYPEMFTSRKGVVFTDSSRQVKVIALDILQKTPRERQVNRGLPEK